MNERGTGVLEQYGLEVFKTWRTRGAVLCETSLGLKLLKEWSGSEKRIGLEYEVLSALGEEIGLQVDCSIKNLDGNLISVDEDQSRYVLRDWYEGQECNTREIKEVLKAAELLARLHQGLRVLEKNHILERRRENDNDEFVSQVPEPLSDVLAKHNRELKRARNYVKGKKQKSDFELVVIGSYEKFYRQAEEAAELADALERTEDIWWCHGEYSHHHVLLGADTCAVTDFSRMRRDVQVSDLYYFARKILEKHRWNAKLGRQILDVYAEVLPLTIEEWQYLYILFLYPEKYWKQINYYVNSSKAWIPARNIDKLQILENQFEPRNQFLEELKKKTV